MFQDKEPSNFFKHDINSFTIRLVSLKALIANYMYVHVPGGCSQLLLIGSEKITKFV